MHPVNKRNFGNHGITVSFHNGTAVVNGYIVRQPHTNRFVVSDGTTIKSVKLAQTLTIANNIAANPTFCTMMTTHPSGTGATFTARYLVESAVIRAGALGTGYTAGDVLTLTATGGAQIVVDSVTSGAITTYHLGTVGATGVTALGANPVAVTGGTGTGATFDLKYKLLSVTSAAGTGYRVNDPINFVGMTAIRAPVARITVVNASGVPQTVTVFDPGTGITVAATGVNATYAAEHVNRIWDSRVRTLEGHTYYWTVNTSVNGSTVIPKFS